MVRGSFEFQVASCELDLDVPQGLDCRWYIRDHHINVCRRPRLLGVNAQGMGADDDEVNVSSIEKLCHQGWLRARSQFGRLLYTGCGGAARTTNNPFRLMQNSLINRALAGINRGCRVLKIA